MKIIARAAGTQCAIFVAGRMGFHAGSNDARRSVSRGEQRGCGAIAKEGGNQRIRLPWQPAGGNFRGDDQTAAVAAAGEE